MNSLVVILGFQISIGLIEVIIFQIGAVILGFAIHFFVASRKSLQSAKTTALPSENEISEADEWRLRYYEQKDLQKKWEEETRQEMEEKEQHAQYLSKKVEEVRNLLEIKRQEEFTLREQFEEANAKLEDTMLHEEALLQELRDLKVSLASKTDIELEQKRKLEEALSELSTTRASIPAEVQPGEYLAQLAAAQTNLLDHNNRITRLLEQIEMLKESERKHLDTMQVNETLQMQPRDFRQALNDKESELKQIRQQQLLIHELKERLEKAHVEYNVLQAQLQKLQSHISKPQSRSFEYEELQQSFFKLTKECDEIKMRQLSLLEENQRLS